MSIIEKSITELIDKDYRSYAMYTLENRAIASYIDGFKTVHRKLMYSMINQFKGNKVKVAELGSSLPSYNYHHGESSAMGAVITLAAEWNNNLPIFRGYGNFGSRMVQEASAPRYIYCDLNPEIKKYFVHHEVCSKHYDIDNPEPQQYLPLIPWILINGIEGIAVGFACKFLPHDPKDIVKACIKAANGKLKDDYDLKVKIPQFKGEIIKDQDNAKRYITRGVVSRVARNKWLITEVPFGYDREKYFNHLAKMVEKKEIRDFDDQCDETGFNFLIKMDNAGDEECAKNPIEFFDLEKPITENYTALDEDGKLVIFENKNDIINRFVDFRIKKIREYIDYEINKSSIELKWLTTKLNFVNDVVSKEINIMNLKKSELVDIVISKYDIDNQIANRLIVTPIYNMSSDQISEIENSIVDVNARIEYLSSLNEKDYYIELLKGI